MKIIRWILETIIGFFIVTLGFIQFFTLPWAGVGIMIAVLITLTFFWKHLTRLSFVKDSQLIRFTTIGLFAVLSLNMMEMHKQSSHAAEKAERQKAAFELAEEEKRESVAYFNAHKSEILDKAALAMESGDYQKVVHLTYKYRHSNDPELSEFHSAAKTQTLLEEAKGTSNDVAALTSIYVQLVMLNPENASYMQKYEELSAELKNLKVKRISAAAAESRQRKIDQQFSTLDGSHKALTKYIIDKMNDPDSYEHVNTFYSDEGDFLIVDTVYRGNNAFGELVTNAIKVKVSLDGKSLQFIY